MSLTSSKITIDPITRLEGHGKIEIFLNDNGDVEKAYLIIPELRGFEKFCVGRPAEDMPQLTSRICGVCPTAHHMAGTKTLDDLYKVEPTETAKKIRELIYNAFTFEDHALHVYVLGGPDFIIGPDAPKDIRNVVGIISKAPDTAKKLIYIRKKVRDLITYLGGKIIHPVFGLAGGVAKGIEKTEIENIKETAREAYEFSLMTLKLFKDIVLNNKDYIKLITSDAYTHKTYYMGMVDENNRVNFYDGKIRVVDPEGNEFLKFDVRDYLKHIAEHIEPWTYIKFCYLKDIGWKGFKDGKDSGIYSVAPLARLNASEGMATPKAQEAYEEMMKTLGKPVHHTLANHWARVIEIIQAAEIMVKLSNDPKIIGKDLRNIPTAIPEEGIGAVEAPRGTLIHHYKTDKDGIITEANLIVATQNNAARINLSVDKAAKSLIKKGNITEGFLNMVEMAFRAYDPCFGCATHCLPGKMPFIVSLRSLEGKVIKEFTRD